jgi:hypothetical protein
MSACGFVFDVVDQPHESLLMGWKASEALQGYSMEIT